MHPVDCPQWEYDRHPARAQLRTRCAELLVRLRGADLDTTSLAADSRPAHLHLFRGLVPVGYDYFAGHYRGEVFRCLRFLDVLVDTHAGHPARAVPGVMQEIGGQVRAGLAGLDAANRLPHAQLSAEDKLLYSVTFACRVFELVLRIHPYANGNGHAARFVLMALLGRYGYWLQRWPLDPRPDPPYIQLITDYRSGNREPLERFILNAIIGP